jgi:hypothetical protein
MDADWHFDTALECWAYRLEGSFVTLEPRPHYCDRGHWIGKVFGVADIDSGDSFPRYFMDEKRARAELAAWLHWRLKK